MKWIMLIILLAGCSSPPHELFWYPVNKMTVSCAAWSGNVYAMKHSKGWRSWPYYMDLTDGKEISLGTDCVMKVTEKYPKYDYPIKDELTKFQKENVIMGGISG